MAMLVVCSSLWLIGTEIGGGGGGGGANGGVDSDEINTLALLPTLSNAVFDKDW